MKLLSLLLIGLFAWNTSLWQTDFEKAKAQASAQHKLLLLNFSGSDWCLPCMRLRKEIFGSEDFDRYATENLVLVNADFPRLKKNRLDKQLISQNESLAALYNKEGKFPFTVLLTPAGKILKQWDGFPGITAEEFVDEIKETTHAGN
jgi:thioredoxin-related protein